MPHEHPIRGSGTETEMANTENNMGAVDVLAVMGRLSESASTLRPYAQDTGGFRVGNKGATELAAACTAALKAAEARDAVAELIAAALAVERLATRHDGDDRMFDRLHAALARCGGAA